jgi:3-hydroxyisobutyrate dehydrogenase
MKVAFIGLGVMGSPMAGHLAKKGFAVTVFNRTRAKAEAWIAKHGGALGETPAQAASGADFVFTCVGNDDDLRQMVSAPGGAFQGMKGGSVLVDHTTASAEVARELAAMGKSKGIEFIDAPVSGGQARAENGKLTVMAGGDPAAFENARPLLEAYAQRAALMGPSGSGQLAKMANQILLAGCIQGLAEGMAFAVKAGLDIPALVAVMSKGGAQSWQLEHRAETMTQGKFDFGFAVDWMRKDLGMCLFEARKMGVGLPVTALVDQFYARVQQRGGGRWDTSSLIDLLSRP